MRSQKGISAEQRRALRRWAHRSYPKPSQKQCIEWFQQEYGHRLSQSSVSESLSKTFAYLDENTPIPTSVRQRAANWPDLEVVLFKWQTNIEEQGGVTSGDILQEKAKRIWAQLPQYSGQACPEFSIRWVEKFKKRHYIQSRTRHGEAGSIPASVEEEMKAIRTIAGEFQEEDIYNMDETGLFWKMLLATGLLSQSRPGLKKQKARISLVFCTNATGTDRFPVWIIGKTKTPRALRNISVSQMGARWRWNSKAWMNTSIMIEWLQAFYLHIGTTRQVLLTMDNFSAHNCAVELAPPPSNIRICFLPANSTSRFQPLDQGIIQNFKAYYRRSWLQFTLDKMEQGLDVQSIVTIRHAIRWIVQSWNTEVTNTMIYNCFRKSTLASNPISLPTQLVPESFSELFDKVVQTGNIRDSMAITNFLNPEGENDDGITTIDPDIMLQEVIDEHLGRDTPDEEEDTGPEQPIYTTKQAQEALEIVFGYTEGREGLSTDFLRSFERFGLILKEELEASKRQVTLDRYISQQN